jgi:hypothetical protein
VDAHNKLQPRRLSHVEDTLKISSTVPLFSTVTIKTSTPHTLWLERTNERYRYLKVWNSRVPLAKSQLPASSKDSPLLDIIGEDSYIKIRSLHVRSGHSLISPTPNFHTCKSATALPFEQIGNGSEKNCFICTNTC